MEVQVVLPTVLSLVLVGEAAVKGGSFVVLDFSLDVSVCEWYRRVYKSLCPVSWVSAWDDRIAEGTFPGKI